MKGRAVALDLLNLAVILLVIAGIAPGALASFKGLFVFTVATFAGVMVIVPQAVRHLSRAN